MARQAEFAQGIAGPSSKPSLSADSQRQNTLAQQAALTPHSVLSAYSFMRSPSNGNSATDAARQTPNGQLPSQNGSAPSTYSQLYPNTFSTRLNVG